MSRCRLCRSGLRVAWNTPLSKSPNFVVLPSLGALVEGWMLVVPKQHFLSMGALPDSMIPEMQRLKQNVFERLERMYGAVCAFEHGPGGTQRSVGCGVDHAHLHMLPLQFDLASAVDTYLPSGSEWRDADLTDCRLAARHGDDYLYLEQPIGRGRIVRHQNLGSQLFRRAIAAYLGLPEEFNWRKNPQIENVNRTIAAFTAEAVDKVSVMSDYAA